MFFSLYENYKVVFREYEDNYNNGKVQRLYNRIQEGLVQKKKLLELEKKRDKDIVLDRFLETLKESGDGD